MTKRGANVLSLIMRTYYTYLLTNKNNTVIYTGVTNDLQRRMWEHKFDIVNTQPDLYCKVFEDNSGALELAKLPKLHPRTKHINVCYHHFCKHVRKGLIKIFPIGTRDQIANTLTKPLAQNDFTCHRIRLCGAWLTKLPMWGSFMYVSTLVIT